MNWQTPAENIMSGSGCEPIDPIAVALRVRRCMFDLSPEARNRKQQPVELPFKFMKASPNAYGACLLNKTPQLAARTLAHTHWAS